MLALSGCNFLAQRPVLRPPARLPASSSSVTQQQRWRQAAAQSSIKAAYAPLLCACVVAYGALCPARKTNCPSLSQAFAGRKFVLGPSAPFEFRVCLSLRRPGCSPSDLVLTTPHLADAAAPMYAGRQLFGKEFRSVQ
jgi:hypothetical protein